jgi:hypothetical protein
MDEGVAVGIPRPVEVGSMDTVAEVPQPVGVGPMEAFVRVMQFARLNLAVLPPQSSRL